MRENSFTNSSMKAILPQECYVKLKSLREKCRTEKKSYHFIVKNINRCRQSLSVLLGFS